MSNDEQCTVCGFLTLGRAHECPGPRPDGLLEVKKAINAVRELVQKHIATDNQGRDRAMTMTKLDEAEMWFVKGWIVTHRSSK